MKTIAEDARMTLLEGIARGEAAVAEGRTMTQAQAEMRIARWIEKRRALKQGRPR